MSQTLKVAVTGAAGQIGYAFLFRLASGQVFGPEVTLELQLLEVEPALAALKGVVMELDDCAFPLVQSITATAQMDEAFSDADWAVLIGSAPRKAGMERSDLLGMNGGIFKAQGDSLNRCASKNVKVFVVGNPCNTNCMIAMHHAPDIPRENFYAMTMLDQHRAYAQLAEKANVPVAQVKGAVIWGNHSATQFPDVYHATINGKPVTDVITDVAWLESDFLSKVQKRGAAIIDARGASSAASAANGIVTGIQQLVNDTPEGEYYSMARHTDNAAYGIDAGLIFSFPCQTVSGECEIVVGMDHNEFAQSKLDATLAELESERQTVLDLGLLNGGS